MKPDCGETKTNGQTPGLNPFLPFDIYIPDGEPKVFGDRVYLYGSFDRVAETYCSDRYHVVSAPVSDLTRWTDHGVSFTTDDVPWSDAALYAPDVLCHNGIYYLFFCMADGSEGVAQSAAPEGPFTGARRITLNGEPIVGIDPSVLEDGGHIYYTWGQFELHMGELNDDLCTLKPESIHTGMLSNAAGREGFHEGSSLRKLGERYCLIYASEYKAAFPNRGARPTKLDYALSASPYGPYTRYGTVIDNEGCDPASWNNHGSIVKVGDTWYVFYHASSENTHTLRRARAERLDVDETVGTIRQAVPTTNGFVGSLLPCHITSPVNACRFFGGACAARTGDGRFAAVGAGEGAGFSFSPILFEAGQYRLTLCYTAQADVRLQVSLGEEAAASDVLPASSDRREIAFLFTAKEGRFPLHLTLCGASEKAGWTIENMQIVKTG